MESDVVQMSSLCTRFMLYRSLLTILLISRLKDLQTCTAIGSKCARLGLHWSPWSIKCCCWLYHLRIVASDNSSPSTQYYSDPSRLYLEDWFCRVLYFKKLTCTWESCRQSKKMNVHLVFWKGGKACLSGASVAGNQLCFDTLMDK